MNDYNLSYHASVIVNQLTFILDYIDDNINLFDNKNTYTSLVSYLSLSLKDKNNSSLLPFLYILHRYNESNDCLQKLLNVYYELHK
jgi:hypothetical protein